MPHGALNERFLPALHLGLAGFIMMDLAGPSVPKPAVALKINGPSTLEGIAGAATFSRFVSTIPRERYSTLGEAAGS
jgi:hypothetical protein